MRRLAFILLLVFSSLAYGQSGEWGSRGITRRLVAVGDRVYAADGRGVAVYDVSSMPVRQVGVAETFGESLDVAPTTDSLLVATRAGIERFAIAPDGTLGFLANYPGANASVIAVNAAGTYIAGFSGSTITIWNPDMSAAAVFPVPQPVSALAWHGDTLIAALPHTAIMSFDPKGNGTPAIVSETAEDLAVVGDTLYVAAGVDGVAQYDIRNEAAPRFLSRAAAGGKNLTRIAVSGNRLIAAEVPEAIEVFDLSSGTPVLTNQLDEPVETVAASGTSLFDAGMVIDAHNLSRATGAPLRVWDLSDASAPKLAGQYSDFAGPVSGVATDGTLAYVVDAPFFRVIDVSKTTAPREIASIPIDNIGDWVRVRGNLAILYGRLQVQLVDISNPYAPALLKTWNTQGAPPSTATFVGSNFIEANPASGFHVVDFNDYATPQQIGGIKGHYYDVVSDGGDVAYVAQEAVTLGTVDVTNPHSPALLSSSVIAPVATEIAPATTNHPELLLSQTKSAIRIYSAANPRSPILASTTPTNSTGVIAADGDTAYVAVAGNVQKIDLRDPAQPQFTPTTMLAVAPMRIAAANGKVVIADKYSLRVYGPDTAPPPPAAPQRKRVADH